MDLQGARVVIIGASSGIGRATAHAFAREGADLILAARRADMLEDAAAECRRYGVRAEAAAMDVTDPGASRHLVDYAVDRFGGIDIWVQNAGSGAVGWFEEVPLNVHRQTIDIILMGAVNGAHAVLPHFIDRGRGVFIATCSVGSWVAPPLAAAYTAAKYGLSGLVEALRQDMRRFPGVEVCGIYPTFVDTPGLRHYANYTGKALKIGGPMQHPEDVARAMVDVARRPRGRAPVGILSSLGRIAYGVAPDLVGGIMTPVIKAMVDRADPAPRRSGNLFTPTRDGFRVHGNVGPGGGPAIRLEPVLTAAGAALGLAAGLLATGARPGRQKRRVPTPARRERVRM